MSLFGSSGIRGKVNKKISPELMLSVGAAVGSLYNDVIIGMDSRSSGDMLSNSLVAGLCSVGSNPYMAGVLPTPTLARAAKEYDAGLMITASHNPADYNGVKMWNPDGSAFDEFQTETVEHRIIEAEFHLHNYDSLGTLRKHQGALEEHRKAIGSKLDCDCDIVVDCASGPTSLITPILLRDMGGSVVTLNSQIDGRFPGRMPEPLEDNLKDLITLVRSRGGIGIAHDGDGDRVVAVDETGRYLGGDTLLSLFVDHLSPSSVAVPIDASLVIDDMVGKVIRTKVGDVFISDAMRKMKIPFGGEPSGTYIFADQGLYPDGVYAAALLANIASEGKLSDRVDELPSYPRMTKKYPLEKAKGAVMANLEEEISSLECEDVITIDGFRVSLDDAWFLIRFSGTEPVIRMTAEARNEAGLKEAVSMADEIIRRCLE